MYKICSSEFGVHIMSIQQMIGTVISVVIIIAHKPKHMFYHKLKSLEETSRHLFISFLSLFQGKNCTHPF